MVFDYFYLTTCTNTIMCKGSVTHANSVLTGNDVRTNKNLQHYSNYISQALRSNMEYKKKNNNYFL